MAKPLQLTYFNFDTLKDLYHENPIAAEQMRTDIINAYIETKPKNRQHRYHALQYSINTWRNKIKSDDARFEIMKAHFYDMAVKFQSSWSLFPDEEKADILPFKIPSEPKDNE